MSNQQREKALGYRRLFLLVAMKERVTLGTGSRELADLLPETGGSGSRSWRAHTAHHRPRGGGQHDI